MINRLSEIIENTFAFWVILFAVLAYYYPTWFTWIEPYIVPLLGVIMFGMGMTLSTADFKEIAKRPGQVGIGVGAQFIIMPVLAYLLALLFNLSAPVAAGVILVGSCPGGTASNVITYLSDGDTALSVAITTVSTILAPVVTPLLMYMLASEWIPIDAVALFWTISKVVIVPIVLGLSARMFFRKQVQKGIRLLPIVSVVTIVIIVAAIVGLSRDKIAQSGLLIFSVIVLHNIFGLLIGYLLAHVLQLDYAKRKAISIEVGMQNSGLGAALAAAHFSPFAAVPSAIFSVWHNISGPIAATLFRKRKSTESQEPITSYSYERKTTS